MVNNLAELTDFDVRVQYEPAPIFIKDQDKLEKAVQETAEKYKSLIVTEDTAKSVKNSRAKLNDIKTKLNKKRIDIHNDYDEPYLKFKSDVDSLISEIDAVIYPIDRGLKELKDQQHQQRLEEVKAIIAESAPNYDVDPSEVEIDSSWLTESITKKKRLDGIIGAIVFIQKEQETLKQNIIAIKDYADMLNIEADGWIQQIKMGQSLNDVMQSMKSAVDRKAKQEEARKAVQSIKTTQHNDVTVDSNGEIVSETVYTTTLKLTGKNVEAFNNLKDYIESYGLKFEVIDKMHKEVINHE